jgi:hypothetical protein
MASDITDDLMSGLTRRAGQGNIIEDCELWRADVILLILTPQILQPPSLQQLAHAIELDKLNTQRLGRPVDRIVPLYSEYWSFGCPEQKAAPKEIKDCLDSHEAVAYRPKRPSFYRPVEDTSHEFEAMLEELIRRIQLVGAQETQPPDDKSQRLAKKRAELTEEKLGRLQKQARELGIAQSEIDKAADDRDPRRQTIELIAGALDLLYD